MNAPGASQPARPAGGEDLLAEVRRLVSSSRAPAVLAAAANLLGPEDSAYPGHREHVLRFCRVLAGEGPMVQEMAQEIVRELTRR